MVALKIMEKRNIKSENMDILTQTEAQVLQNTSHPNLMDVFRLIETKDKLAFACEYIESGSLENFM